MNTIRPLVTIDRRQLGGKDAMRVGRKTATRATKTGESLQTTPRTAFIKQPGGYTLDEYIEAKRKVQQLESSLSARVAEGTLSGLGLLKEEARIQAMKLDIRKRQPRIFRRANKHVSASKLRGVKTIAGKLVQNTEGIWIPVVS